MRHFFTILLLFFIGTATSYATHLVGGELSYEYLQGDFYRVTLKVYRDCDPATNTNNAEFDEEASIAAYDTSGMIYADYKVPLLQTNIRRLLPAVNDPCLTPPNICIEEAIYEIDMYLPPIPGGLTVAYQRCCRSPVVLNLKPTIKWGTTITTDIPYHFEHGINSSPTFKNYPPLAICADIAFTFDHSAVDPDGDSLVYSLCSPLHGGSVMLPAPTPPDPPPYQEVVWDTGSGFSATQQIAANPDFAIDSLTGILTGTANALGSYTFVVCVKEYRNGVLINQIMRDFQITTTLCIQTTADFLEQDSLELCEGKTIDFSAIGNTSAFYHWDFGDPLTLGDTSILYAPTYTFTDTGTFLVKLKVNAHLWCSDSSEKEFKILPALIPQVFPVPTQCLDNNSFDFEAGGIFRDSTLIYWDFDSLVTDVDTIWGSNADNVTFNEAGLHNYILTFEDYGCIKQTIGETHVFPHPVPDFSAEELSGCIPFHAQLINESVSITPMSYTWSLDDSTFSTEVDPAHLYTEPRSYSVSLTVTTDSGCIDTVTKSKPLYFTAHPLPEAGFYPTPSEASIFEPIFEFSDTSKSSVNCLYAFGNGDTSFACGSVIYEYGLKDTGNLMVTQIVENQFECLDTTHRTVRVEPQFIFYIPNAFTPNGDGLNERWNPKVLYSKNYTLRIYSRWGDLIFQTFDPDYGWDGTATKSETRIAPSGVYSYLIELTTFENREFFYTGSVKLIR